MQYILISKNVVRTLNLLGFTRSDLDQRLPILSKDYLTTYAGTITFLSTEPIEPALKNKSTREVHVKQDDTYKAIESSIKALKCFGIYVILCTAMPMDLTAHN